MNHHSHPPLWRPKSYPVQTYDDTSPNASRWSSTTASEPLQIPRTIRAVRDSNTPAQGRTLVICLDGTGDSFDNDNSNVVNFVACLKKDDPSQITYYQSGIGTYDHRGLKSGISSLIDMAIGSGLGIHIRDAYRFLMANYNEGDRICLLGFSRGSYTVRCLAGMLHKVGLLPAHNSAQVTFAYKFYKDDSPQGWKMSAEFKRTFCMDVSVFFVGVWDCVASVGFVPRKLPFSKSATNKIGFFRHAMALDEHRAKFKVCRWQPDEKLNAITKRSEMSTESGLKRIFNLNSKSYQKRKEREKREINQAQLEALFNHYDHHYSPAPIKPHKTDALEVWFAGAHADVGGGAVRNEERHMLSRIPLRWMIRQCFECNTGILFSSAALAETGLDVQTLFPIYVPCKKPIVGPGPKALELWEKGRLPPLKRRSTALGIDEHAHHLREKGMGNYKSDGIVREEKRRSWLDHDDMFIRGGDGKPSSFEIDLLPEQVEDYFDSVSPINDMLSIAKAWWILELLPIKVKLLQPATVTPQPTSKELENNSEREEKEKWRKAVRMNLGRYRCVEELEPNMHWTVQWRMDGECAVAGQDRKSGKEEGEVAEKYRVKARVGKETVWRCVA
ncbi:hypothetical protein EG329_012639 [Mollisiaceae sp. DMI_Dod_QoI]|nr:hypothetical protein EG329_012639 [Helotiales sp. DMI_Dod_QoI]